MAGRSKPNHRGRQTPDAAKLPRVGAPRSRKPPANDNRAPSGVLARRVAGIVSLVVALAVLLWVGVTSF